MKSDAKDDVEVDSSNWKPYSAVWVSWSSSSFIDFSSLTLTMSSLFSLSNVLSRGFSGGDNNWKASDSAIVLVLWRIPGNRVKPLYPFTAIESSVKQIFLTGLDGDLSSFFILSIGHCSLVGVGRWPYDTDEHLLPSLSCDSSRKSWESENSKGDSDGRSSWRPYFPIWVDGTTYDKKIMMKSVFGFN